MTIRTIKQTAPSIAVAIGALALVSALIVRTSDAAFTDSVSSAGNSFQAGTVNLTSSAGSALINVTALEPGQSTTACLVVSYDGSVVDPEPVSLHYPGSGAIQGDTVLASWLRLDVEQGPAGSNCGFTVGSGSPILNYERLVDFATRGTYSAGALGWDPNAVPGDVARPYRFTVTLDPLTPNTVQNLSVTNIEFIWEITS